MKNTRSVRVLCLNIFTGERLERIISIVDGWIEIINPWEPDPFVIIFEPDRGANRVRCAEREVKTGKQEEIGMARA